MAVDDYSSAGGTDAAGSHTARMHEGNVGRYLILIQYLGHAHWVTNLVQRVDPSLGEAARRISKSDLVCSGSTAGKKLGRPSCC